MNNFGLIVIINKYNKNIYSSYSKTFNIINIDEGYNKLIEYLAEQFNHLIIDFPQDLDDFEYIWFDNSYVNSSVFDYYIFNDKWIQPWNKQELYEDVLNLMFDKETKKTKNDELDHEKSEEQLKDTKVSFEDKLKEFQKHLDNL